MKKLVLAACMATMAPGAALAAGSTNISEVKYQRLAREQAMANLKDPGSAQFRNQNGFCGEVNSKNALGGYVGYQKFIAAGETMVVFERDSSLEKGVFQQVWGEICK